MRWIGVKCNVCRIATVSIDGGAPKVVNTAGPGVPGRLTSEPVFSTSGLAPDATHTLVITVTGALSGTIAGAESNGIAGTPVYAAGNGWSSESGGRYSLAAGSPGYDQGTRIPNFNDGFLGAGPDIGAHEAGGPAMSFGVNAVSTSW